VAEYQIGDLSRVSGVSERNIRAYRERGLLAPPRRRGRTAWYDEDHLTQLTMINKLLEKGFTSTHIARFLEGIRHGRDLADVLELDPGPADGASDSADVGAVVDSIREAVDELAARVLAALPDSARHVHDREVAARLVSRRLRDQMLQSAVPQPVCAVAR